MRPQSRRRLSRYSRSSSRTRSAIAGASVIPRPPAPVTTHAASKASGLGVKEGVVEATRAMTNVKLVSLPWA